jgi:hypothetical protein
LPLLGHGVILRLRQNSGDKDDSTVKLRPFDQARLTPRWLEAGKQDSWEFKVEGDWVGDRRVVAASLVADQDEVKEVGRRQAPPSTVFTAEQEQWGRILLSATARASSSRRRLSAPMGGAATTPPSRQRRHRTPSQRGRCRPVHRRVAGS